MVIGLLYEGKNDREPLERLVQRIIGEKAAVTDWRVREYAASGHVDSKTGAALTIFFDDPNEKCDFAVVMSDVEGDKDRCRRIRQVIDGGMHPRERIALACADPKFESWLLMDKGAILKIFELDNEIPHEEVRDSKQRLRKIIDEYSIRKKDVILGVSDYYVRIVENLNLRLLVKMDINFKDFYLSIGRMTRLMNSNRRESG
jgi:hypothetical protein